MNISYDVKADALYIKLIPGRHQVQTHCVDDDIAVVFDESDRLVGIEVLDASKRLELPSLFPLEVTGVAASSLSEDGAWDRLKHELLKRKAEGRPVKTLDRRSKSWVEEVGNHYIIVRRDTTGNACEISRAEFEDGTQESLRKRKKWAIVRALRDIAAPHETVPDRSSN